MLLTLRFPVVDLRQFQRSDYADVIRLPRTWSEDEFVRSFGQVKKRLKGPVEQWPTERVFSRYSRVLRFPRSFPMELTRRADGQVEFFGINRRLYPATFRNDLFHLEVQVTGASRAFQRWGNDGWAIYEYAPFDLPAVLTGLLEATVTIKGPVGSVTTKLRHAGPDLAAAFEQATMRADAAGHVVSGAPAVVLEVMDHEEPGSAWRMRKDVEGGLSLYAEPRDGRKLGIQTWMISRQIPDSRRSRELRIHLLRLHSEREFLRQLCRLLLSSPDVNQLDETRSNSLQEAVSESLALLTRWKAYGFNNFDLMQVAFAADRVVTTQEYEVLAERVKSLRGIIAKRLNELHKIEDDLGGGGYPTR
jgi:hypothetical protein